MYKWGIVAGLLIILLVTTSGCSFLATTPGPATKPGITDVNSPRETPTIPQQYVASSPGAPKTGSGGGSIPNFTLQIPTLIGGQNVTINGTGLNTTNVSTSPTDQDASIPFAQFTSNVMMGYAPLTVNFIDTSLNLPTAWSWTFGDGTSSTLQNPSHTYYNGGRYNVSFTASNAAGSSIPLISPNYVSVYVPGFSATPTYGPAPLIVTFIDTGYGYPPPASWDWSFGDGTYSTRQNMTHQYLFPGTYDVNLRISGMAGTTWVNKSALITVT